MIRTAWNDASWNRFSRVASIIFACLGMTGSAPAQLVLESLGGLNGGGSSSSSAISSDGSTVVGSTFGSGGFEAFRWTKDDGMTGLGDLDGGEFFSFATAVSA